MSSITKMRCICIARVVIADMAESLKGSFSVDEFELNVLENAAAIPNVDNITKFYGRVHCLRGTGRNFCPCKSVNSFYSSVCHGNDFGCCMNDRRVQESDSKDTVNLSNNSFCCLIFDEVLLYIFQTVCCNHNETTY